MNVQTDRACVAADSPAVRYCTVTIAAPAPPAGEPRDAELIIRDSHGVTTTCLNDVMVDDDIDGAHIRLGDLAGGRAVTLVLATNIGARSAGASTAILLRLADRDRVLYGAPMEVPWRVVDAETNRAQPINREVLVSAAMLIADHARREARELERVNAGDRAQAALRKAVARVRELEPESREINAIANDLEDAVLRPPARRRRATSAARTPAPRQSPVSATSGRRARTA